MPPDNFYASDLNRCVNATQDTNTNISPNIKDFEAFLVENGGHSGGWEEYDHVVFLRCRERHKGKQIFLTEVSDLLCGQSLESVQQHEMWYQTYLNKKGHQRDAVKKWRRAKELLKEQVKRQVKQPKNLYVKDNERVKIAIEKWKAKVKDQKRLVEEKAREELKKLETEKQNKEKYKNELQQRVSAYREAKRVVDARDREEKEAREKEEEERRAAAKIPLSFFLKKDAAIFVVKENKRKLQLKEKEDRQARIDKIVQQVSVKAERDSQRLNKSTKSWQERTRSPKRSGEVIRAPFKIHCRGVPQWRKGLAML